MRLNQSYFEDIANMYNFRRDKDNTKQLLQWQFGSNIAQKIHTCMLHKKMSVTSSSLYRPGVSTLMAELRICVLGVVCCRWKGKHFFLFFVPFEWSVFYNKASQSGKTQASTQKVHGCILLCSLEDKGNDILLQFILHMQTTVCHLYRFVLHTVTSHLTLIASIDVLCFQPRDGSLVRVASEPIFFK